LALAGLAPAAALLLTGSPGRAAPPRLPVPAPPRVDPADQLIEDAAASTAQGHLEAACAKLEESRKLRRASRTLLLLARCYAQLALLSQISAC
jgi:hypothetical protein